MSARHALKEIDDRPIQIFVPKLAENPTGWAVPVQRVLTVLKPLQALEFSSRCVSTPRSASARTLHGTATSVGLNCNGIQLSILPRLGVRTAVGFVEAFLVNRFFSTARLTSRLNLLRSQPFNCSRCSEVLPRLRWNPRRQG